MPFTSLHKVWICKGYKPILKKHWKGRVVMSTTKIITVVAQGDILHDESIPCGIIGLHIDTDTISQTYDKRQNVICYVAFAYTRTYGNLWVYSKTSNMENPYILETVKTHKITECNRI